MGAVTHLQWLVLCGVLTLSASAPYLKTGTGQGHEQLPLDHIFSPSQGLIGPLFRPNDHSVDPPAHGGCYYQFRHYDEGDRIITNEPCLNCTCHNSMLMCYLKVCPFSKPIGLDCTVEKKINQCCPVINCPQVPVNLQLTYMISSTTTFSPSSTEVVPYTEHGCSIDGEFYPDGAKVPGDYEKPCELCYCIRNHTACVMQECTLKIDGCEPVFMDGVCCPMRYQCEYEDDQITTTMLPVNETIVTTTMPLTGGCTFNSEFYADGASLPSSDPCEHCYCMKKDIVCAVRECRSPLDEADENCVPRLPPPGHCCPEAYDCPETSIGTTIYAITDVSQTTDKPTAFEETTLEDVSEAPEEKDIPSDVTTEIILQTEGTLVPTIDDFPSVSSTISSIVTSEEIGTEPSRVPDQTSHTPDPSELEFKIKDISDDTESTKSDTVDLLRDTVTPPTDTDIVESDVTDDTDVQQTEVGTTEVFDETLLVSTESTIATNDVTDSVTQAEVTKSSVETDTEKITLAEISPIITTPESEITTEKQIIIESTEQPDMAIDSMEPKIPGEGNCLVNTETYMNGASVPITDQCQESCSCKNSVVACNVTACPSPPAAFLRCDTTKHSDQCCDTYKCPTVEPAVAPPSASCIRDDLQYLEGDYVPSHDLCTDCYCINGEIICATLECPAVEKHCIPVSIPAGSCCATKYECPQSMVLDDVTTQASLITTDEDVDSLDKEIPAITSIPDTEKEIMTMKPVTEVSVAEEYVTELVSEIETIDEAVDSTTTESMTADIEDEIEYTTIPTILIPELDKLIPTTMISELEDTTEKVDIDEEIDPVTTIPLIDEVTDVIFTQTIKPVVEDITTSTSMIPESEKHISTTSVPELEEIATTIKPIEETSVTEVITEVVTEVGVMEEVTDHIIDETLISDIEDITSPAPIDLESDKEITTIAITLESEDTITTTIKPTEEFSPVTEIDIEDTATTIRPSEEVDAEEEMVSVTESVSVASIEEDTATTIRPSEEVDTEEEMVSVTESVSVASIEEDTATTIRPSEEVDTEKEMVSVTESVSMVSIEKDTMKPDISIDEIESSSPFTTESSDIGEQCQSFDNIVYQHDDKVPSNDSCEYDCKCANGKIKCQQEACPSAPPAFFRCASHLSQTSDDCCPTYVCVAPVPSQLQCMHNGKSYSNGDIINSDSICDDCYCIEGTVVCATVECRVPSRDNCRPATHPTEKCCPTSYECDADKSTIKELPSEKPSPVPIIVDGTIQPEDDEAEISMELDETTPKIEDPLLTSTDIPIELTSSVPLVTSEIVQPEDDEEGSIIEMTIPEKPSVTTHKVDDVSVTDIEEVTFTPLDVITPVSEDDEDVVVTDMFTRDQHPDLDVTTPDIVELLLTEADEVTVRPSDITSPMPSIITQVIEQEDDEEDSEILPAQDITTAQIDEVSEEVTVSAIDLTTEGKDPLIDITATEKIPVVDVTTSQVVDVSFTKTEEITAAPGEFITIEKFTETETTTSKIETISLTETDKPTVSIDVTSPALEAIDELLQPEDDTTDIATDIKPTELPEIEKVSVTEAKYITDVDIELTSPVSVTIHAVTQPEDDEEYTVTETTASEKLPEIDVTTTKIDTVSSTEADKLSTTTVEVISPITEASDELLQPEDLTTDVAADIKPTEFPAFEKESVTEGKYITDVTLELTSPVPAAIDEVIQPEDDDTDTVTELTTPIPDSIDGISQPEDDEEYPVTEISLEKVPEVETTTDKIELVTLMETDEVSVTQVKFSTPIPEVIDEIVQPEDDATDIETTKLPEIEGVLEMRNITEVDIVLTSPVPTEIDGVIQPEDDDTDAATESSIPEIHPETEVTIPEIEIETIVPDIIIPTEVSVIETERVTDSSPVLTSPASVEVDTVIDVEVSEPDVTTSIIEEVLVTESDEVTAIPETLTSLIPDTVTILEVDDEVIDATGETTEADTSTFAPTASIVPIEEIRSTTSEEITESPLEPFIPETITVTQYPGLDITSQKTQETSFTDSDEITSTPIDLTSPVSEFVEPEDTVVITSEKVSIPEGTTTIPVDITSLESISIDGIIQPEDDADDTLLEISVTEKVPEHDETTPKFEEVSITETAGVTAMPVEVTSVHDVVIQPEDDEDDITEKITTDHISDAEQTTPIVEVVTATVDEFTPPVVTVISDIIEAEVDDEYSATEKIGESEIIDSTTETIIQTEIKSTSKLPEYFTPVEEIRSTASEEITDSPIDIIGTEDHSPEQITDSPIDVYVTDVHIAEKITDSPTAVHVTDDYTTVEITDIPIVHAIDVHTAEHVTVTPMDKYVTEEHTSEEITDSPIDTYVTDQYTAEELPESDVTTPAVKDHTEVELITSISIDSHIKLTSAVPVTVTEDSVTEIIIPIEILDMDTTTLKAEIVTLADTEDDTSAPIQQTTPLPVSIDDVVEPDEIDAVIKEITSTKLPELDITILDDVTSTTEKTIESKIKSTSSVIEVETHITTESSLDKLTITPAVIDKITTSEDDDVEIASDVTTPVGPTATDMTTEETKLVSDKTTESDMKFTSPAVDEVSLPEDDGEEVEATTTKIYSEETTITPVKLTSSTPIAATEGPEEAIIDLLSSTEVFEPDVTTQKSEDIPTATTHKATLIPSEKITPVIVDIDEITQPEDDGEDIITEVTTSKGIQELSTTLEGIPIKPQTTDISTSLDGILDSVTTDVTLFIPKNATVTSTMITPELIEIVSSYLGPISSAAETTTWTPSTTTEFILGPGSCLFDGTVYVSAQQIPRDDPCDFCFCFRGDIICLQQTCPPPIPGCYEEAIPGFCCPRYECPVKQTVIDIITTTTPFPHYPPTSKTSRETVCKIEGEFYAVGEVVKAASSPCHECKCGGDGFMKCLPKECDSHRKMYKRSSSLR